MFPSSLELFAGGGGMALGLHLAGFRHVSLVEIEERACSTLFHNAKFWHDSQMGSPPWGLSNVKCIDVRDFIAEKNLDSTNVDIIAGGPPCQPFSLGGVHAGMNDKRNMFPAALELVRILRPKLVLFENVAGLLRPSFLPYFDYVQRQLTNIHCARLPEETWVEHNNRLCCRQDKNTGHGYHVTRQLVNAADYGIPQIRKRVFLMAVRNDILSGPLPPLTPTHSEEALRHEQVVTHEYWNRHRIKPPESDIEAVVTEDHSDKKMLLPWKTVRDAIADLPIPIDGKPDKNILNHIGIPGARSYPGHTGSEIDRPSKTIKAGVHGVCGGEAMIRFPNGRLRYMTVREAARIQTFPDDYEFLGARSHAMRHIGNAVPVQLAALVGHHLRTYANM